MITDEEVLRLFERAKPAPVDDAASVLDAAGYLDALVARSNELTRVENEPTREPMGAEAMVVDLGSTRRERTGDRRWLVLTAAAMVVVLIAGGVALRAATHDSTNVQVPAGQAPTSSAPPPSTLQQNSVSPPPPLPPIGATPSTPEHGDLVAAFDGSPCCFPAHVYVYADGRVISQVGTPFVPVPWFIERRLTPKGVERVRALILATGLFDPDVPPPGSGPASRPVFPDAGQASDAVIRVRNGDRLVSLTGAPDLTWTRAFEQLGNQLSDLKSWLPARAWQDRKSRQYVASEYAVCIQNDESPPHTPLSPIDQAAVFAALPGPAAEVLAAKPTNGDPATTSCFLDLTTDEARTIWEAFWSPASVKAGQFHLEVPAISKSVGVWILAALPHGDMASFG